MTQVYSFKATEIHSYACYLGGFLCDSWHKFILSKLLESIPLHLILGVVYRIQLLHDSSFTLLSPIWKGDI